MAADRRVLKMQGSYLKGAEPLANLGCGSTSGQSHQNRSRRTRDGGRQAIPRTRRLQAGFRKERSGAEPAWTTMASRGNELGIALRRPLHTPPPRPTQAKIGVSGEEPKRSRVT